jgi:hypothetical protein
MSEETKTRPQDTRLAGIKCDVPPEKRYTWLKRSDAARKDAFEGSQKPLSEQADARRR